ncbi:hypothetical protein Ahy_B01g056544 [Arachis hypogaea]|uniref:DUF4283 domain-containing protein n=1 Tax=Arachis hypogaea TaxID=3818 RepID=A0A445AZ74_ARAHY|nr:hypothetical protein Ahy_B01g056544 [Arachis hypogaea]
MNLCFFFYRLSVCLLPLRDVLPLLPLPTILCLLPQRLHFGFGQKRLTFSGASSWEQVPAVAKGKRRAVEQPVNKATLQKQRRMIKNRDSATRSRECKQLLEFVIPVSITINISNFMASLTFLQSFVTHRILLHGSDDQPVTSNYENSSLYVLDWLLPRIGLLDKIIVKDVWLAKYSPRLLHWVVTQNCLPSNSVIEKNPAFFNTRDIDILKIILGFPIKEKLREQVIFDTLLGDWIVAFGNWEFDPLKLNNPFGHNISKVHIWQGYEDKVVSSQIQRFVSRNMPWINYGEVSDERML